MQAGINKKRYSENLNFKMIFLGTDVSCFTLFFFFFSRTSNYLFESIDVMSECLAKIYLYFATRKIKYCFNMPGKWILFTRNDYNFYFGIDYFTSPILYVER